MNVATHLRNHAYSQFGIFEGFYHITKEKNVNQMAMARMLAATASAGSTEFRYAWKSKQSKNPRHLRFGDDGQLGYMRDGTLTTTNGYSGTYDRVKEFAGPDGDEHEVAFRIACDVWDGETQVNTKTPHLNKTLIAVMAMSLEDWPNDELAAFNNAISWQDKLPKQNKAFDRAVETAMVNADGRIPAIEELREALSFEINRRLDAGTFN